MSSTLRRGSRGTEVVRLQQLLNRQLSPVPRLAEDGDFGPATEAAVRRYQQREGLEVDGVVGPNTWAALEGGGSGTGSGTPRADATWMPIAQAEAAAGVHEIAGSRHNPRIIQYHATTGLRAQTDETPWCSSFVNWCLQQAGIRGTNSAAAASWLNWGTSVEARYGAITVIYNAGAAASLSSSGNHVGFLLEETPTAYRILGGNQSDMVKESTFAKTRWRLKGYRWPT